MNFKRCLFVGALMLLFLCCYHIMNQHVDELSRYQYTTEENRKIILEHMSTEEINVLIDRQYKPEDFMRYLGIDGFNIRYVDWYNHAREVENLNTKDIVFIVNGIYGKMNFFTFKTMTQYYSMTQLKNFYLEENSFVNDLSLVENPTLIKNKIDGGKTLFTYVPKELIEIKELPIANQIEKKESIALQKPAADSLVAMCKASFDINEKVCGNMIVTQGYVSYELQETLYQEGLIEYGVEEVFNYVDYPGTSIYQLGNIVKLVPVGIEQEENEETEKVMTEQQAWLVEHVKEYGFEFVEDPSEVLDEFVLQFVGIEVETTNEGEE